VALSAEALPDAGRAETARPGGPAAARQARRRRLDRVASRVVVAGGVLVIGSILAILAVLGAEILPLFREPRAHTLPAAAFAAGPAAGATFGADEHREVAFALGPDGRLRLADLADGRSWPAVVVPALAGARVTAAAPLGRSRYLLGTSDGRTVPFSMGFRVDFASGRRAVSPEPAFGSPAVLDVAGRPVLRLAAAEPESGSVTVAQVGPLELVVRVTSERRSLVGAPRREEALRPLRVEADGEVTALAVDGRGDDLFVGTSGGQVVRYDLRDRAQPVRAETVAVAPGPVTVLGFLLGDRTLVAGDAGGGVSTWQVVRADEARPPRLTRIHRFAPHGAPVTALAVSARDKGFVTADAAGGVRLHYGTTGRTLLRLTAPEPAVAVAIAPKADAILAVSAGGRITHWAVDNPHPEVTLGALFGPVWYEGYPRPDRVWQSTGGTDDFEPKLSLTPLVFGTVKGTFYALLFAVPLALLAALYVSEFMHPALRACVKPVVEIMAALPSVVLGFVAGLWLAPAVERVVPGLVVLPLVLAPVILAAAGAWSLMPARLRWALRPGAELAVLVPLVLVGGAAALALGAGLERLLPGGDYRAWLRSALGLTYDQRNSLVVGIAMGFAVIPIIFTVAEDSLAGVPQHLRAGSLALGATRWQTAIRVVLPTASPGIFSAAMIGFGRAVGETMIVLMATGNTPVMDGSIFSGFRALSANIAVELPEAPEGGTLFRVLFLAALLLFAMTFAVNTAAEVVRLRLRRKYRAL
jgi:phosphate transport system permease protein